LDCDQKSTSERLVPSPSSDPIACAPARGQTKELARYIALAEQAQEALKQAVDVDAESLLGPSQYVAGLDADLAALCVRAP
jgi:hypothetical protein